MNLIGIACRNIGRNRRRSVLSILAVSLASMFLLFFMSFQKGSYLDMIDNAVRSHSGHFQVQRPGYIESRDLADMLEEPGRAIELLEGLPHVVAYAPRVNAPMLVNKGSHTFGGLMFGIDPTREAAATTLDEMIIEGSYLEAEDREGVVLSEMLARNLEAGIGDEIVFVGQGADGSMAAGKLILRGIFRFGVSDMDRTVLAAHIDTIQDAFGMRGGVSEIAVLLDGDAFRPAVTAELAERIRSAGLEDAEVVGWPDVLPGIEQMIKMDWNSGLVMYGVLVLVVGFGIANTFLMAFMERIHEYGVLLSLGMKPLAVSLMTYLESLVLTLLGLLGGLILGIPLTLYFQKHGMQFKGAEDVLAEYGMNPVVHTRLSLEVVLMATGIVAGITIAMALYPALKASRLKPVEALRRG